MKKLFLSVLAILGLGGVHADTSPAAPTFYGSVGGAFYAEPNQALDLHVVAPSTTVASVEVSWGDGQPNTTFTPSDASTHWWYLSTNTNVTINAPHYTTSGVYQFSARYTTSSGEVSAWSSNLQVDVVWYAVFKPNLPHLAALSAWIWANPDAFFKVVIYRVGSGNAFQVIPASLNIGGIPAAKTRLNSKGQMMAWFPRKAVSNPVLNPDGSYTVVLSGFQTDGSPIGGAAIVF